MQRDVPFPRLQGRTSSMALAFIFEAGTFTEKWTIALEYHSDDGEMCLGSQAG